MDPSWITETNLRDALKSLRAARPFRANPLLGLDAITLRLEAEGMRDAPESRAWALGGLLDEIVSAELDLRRNRPSASSTSYAAKPLTPEAEHARLLADFQHGDPELEAWSLVQARYLATRRVTVAQLTRELGLVRRTIERRTRAGIAALTLSLREAERAASRSMDHRPDLPPAERVIVLGDAVQARLASPTESRSRAGRTNPTLASEPAPTGGQQAEDPIRSLRLAVLTTLRDEAKAIRLGPAQVLTLLRNPAEDLQAYRLARIVEWSQPRYRLDQRFVELSLLVDQGEEAGGGRWRLTSERYDRLRDLMEAVSEPALVLLGPPGSGKSTLLRRLELDLACEALRGEHERVSFYVPLNHYRAALDGDPSAPADWLASRWAARFPELPPLVRLLEEGRLTLLLDALNEMPHRDAADYRRKVLAWKQFLHETALARPGNRVVFSCRSLDYSAPLSTPALRVPQVRIEPLDDARARRFLDLYSPARAERIWHELAGTAQLELLRSPYFLALLVRYVESEDRIPIGRAGLFSGFVRQALRREVERDNPLFAPNGLLSARDLRRIALAGRAGAFDLPEEGALLPRLSRLAFEMQRRAQAGRAAQVRVDRAEALALLDHPESERILSAGLALAVLDEPASGRSLSFFHQLLQEYFAARRLAAQPEPELMLTDWHAEAISPPLMQVLASLPPSEPLPPLPATGWEETALLAAPMAADPEAFVRNLAEHNLALAGRCAGQPELREMLSEASVDRLRWQLAQRSRDPEAELRARIEAARALGHLGDPRFERRLASDGSSFLMPPMVEVPGGSYPIGTDDPDWPDCGPARKVDLAPFRIGKFPVTNAEWACFMAAGGYEDPRWWPGKAAQAWQAGQSTAEGSRESFRDWRRRLKADPGILDEKHRAGLLPRQNYEDWLARMRMGDDEFEAHLRVYWPDGRKRAPEFWTDPDFNHPSQPVVGVCWFEARAYSLWLAEVSGEAFRLPDGEEWEAAARPGDPVEIGAGAGETARGEGAAGREPAAIPETELGNSAAAHLMRSSPVGVFPDGNTAAGAADMFGNVHEWVVDSRPPAASSTQGIGGTAIEADGRAGRAPRQPLRSRSYIEDRISGSPWAQSWYEPDLRARDAGMRLACNVEV